jgi:hypothetical protein
MAKLEFGIIKSTEDRTKKYFLIGYKHLLISLDKLNAVIFDHDFKDLKEHVSIKHIRRSTEGSMGTLGGVFYQPGHADHFYFNLNGFVVHESILLPASFNNRDHLIINFPKYKHIEDAISDLIIENYSLDDNVRNIKFFKENKQTFETESEFYWAMKYLLLKSHRKLDKVFPTGHIFMKSDY